MPKIRLRCSDGEIIHVDYEIIHASTTIKNLVDTMGLMENNSEIIPISKIEAKTLKMIIEWATKHKDDDSVPVEDDDDNHHIDLKKRVSKIPVWDIEFLNNMDQNTLFDVIAAANYLDIKVLLNTSCLFVSNMISGKCIDELRTLFNIVNDFTPEEEIQIAKENTAWQEK